MKSKYWEWVLFSRVEHLKNVSLYCSVYRAATRRPRHFRKIIDFDQILLVFRSVVDASHFCEHGLWLWKDSRIGGLGLKYISYMSWIHIVIITFSQIYILFNYFNYLPRWHLLQFYKLIFRKVVFFTLNFNSL